MTPEGLDKALEFGSAGHRKMADAVSARLRMSERKMRDRYRQMSKNEERFQAFIPESDNDAIRREKRESNGLPAYRTIEVPYSYASLMTAHTYYTSVFLARSPVFQVSGRHGEAEMNVQSVEAVLDYQRQVGEWMIPLFIWLLDPGKYGFGVVGHYWEEKNIRYRKVVEEPITFLGMPLSGKTRKTDKIVDVPSYHGNKVFNVRPQDFFPDPRVALRYFQKGEFVARYVENSWADIVAGAKAGNYFNVDTLRKMRKEKEAEIGDGTLIARDTGSRVADLPGRDFVAEVDVPAGFVKSYEMMIRLSPKEWQLDKTEEQEVWAVTISTNGVVYGCQPVGECSDQFPFDVIEHEPEGYSMFSRSMLEISQPLADIVTWLFNTHFYNVRASLNNQLIVDPSMVVMKDVENPNPGKIIRLKPNAYGRDVRTLLSQLPVQDVTRSNIGDISMVTDFIQKVLGVSEATMGALPQKSHTTATASRISSSFGVNRMKTNCEYYSAMGFVPFTQKIIQRTQNNLSVEMQLRTVGDLAQFGKPFVQVSADSIAGFYDYVPVDGTMPVDRFAQANLWQMILGNIQKYPQILATYDIAKIFAWVSTLAGIKNIAQFRLVPDQQLLAQAKAGNVVPINQSAIAQRRNSAEPGQVPNMGPTG